MVALLDRKVAVVTGSGRGVGRGLARLMASHGAQVVTNDLAVRAGKPSIPPTLGGAENPVMTDQESAKFRALDGDADTTAAAIVAAGGQAVACYADVSDYDDAGRLIQAAIDHFGRIDILINNAGVGGFGPFLTLSPERFDALIKPKLYGTYNCMKHAVPHMIEQGYGRVLNCSSGAWVGIAMMSGYAAVNAAEVAFSISTAKELARYGVTVNAYCPQAESPTHVVFNATLRAMVEEKNVEVNYDPERMGDIEDAHGPAENMTFLAWLVSEEAADVTGSLFSVTGRGDIAVYGTPRHAHEMTKRGEPWTLDELRAAIPDQLLADYIPIAARSEF
jgi:3-oxoacyl-[acyl-carrier protein] reductase